MISLLSVNKPDWYLEAKKSGALDTVIHKEGTILGPAPYQHARRIAIIAAIASVILEHSSFLVIGAVFFGVSLYCKARFNGEKERIMKIHNQIIQKQQALKL
jgi:hypothetical protein